MSEIIRPVARPVSNLVRSRIPADGIDGHGPQRDDLVLVRKVFGKPKRVEAVSRKQILEVRLNLCGDDNCPLVSCVAGHRVLGELQRSRLISRP